MLVTLPLFAVIGYGIHRSLFSRSLKAGPLSTLLVTFGLSVVIQNALLQGFSADTRTLDMGVLNTGAFHLNDQLSISYLGLLTLVLAVVVIAGVQLFLSRTRTGQMMRAVSDDADTASAGGRQPGTCTRSPPPSRSARWHWPASCPAMRSSFDPSHGTDAADLRVRGGGHRRPRLALGNPGRRRRARPDPDRRARRSTRP